MKDQFRQEYKFTIHTSCVRYLRRVLPGVMSPDAHSGPDGYRIRSLYFDDTDHTAYRDKTDGTKDRIKYRIRYYNYDESYIILEKKERRGDLCRKVTQEISPDMARAMASGLPSGGDAPLLREFDLMRTYHGLRPAVIVDYRRYAFFHPLSDTRVTLDCDLVTPGWDTELFRPDPPSFRVFGEKEALLELKYDLAPPESILSLLSAVPAQRTANSKYARCLAMLDD